KMSDTALKALKAYAPDPRTLAQAVGAPHDEALWELVHARVSDKLAKEAVEDFRIDFEDGYGNRPEAEEDGHAQSAAREAAKGMREGSLPPFFCFRIKPVNEDTLERRRLSTE